MADVTDTRPGAHGVAGVLDAFVADEGATTLREVAFPAQVDLRVDVRDRALVAAIEEALGVELPLRPNTTAEATDLTAVWLGPDQWLLCGAPGAEAQIVELLEDAAGDGHCSIVDVSANRTALELSGPDAVELLATACLLDLHPRAFAVGACAQTPVAGADTVLVKLDDAPTFRLLVRPSFALHVAHWLLDARAELALDAAA